jgi:abhydrolase domain-containing protein 14
LTLSNPDTPRLVAVDGHRFRVTRSSPAEATSVPRKPLVVLFHGYSFSLDDWIRIGTPKILSSHGYSSVAIDLPSGKASQSDKLAKIDLPEVAALLQRVLAELGWSSARGRKLVIVGPSMGGGFALSIALEAPAFTAGLVLIAPSTRGLSMESLETLDIPTLLIWGERDNVFPLEEHARDLKNTLPRSKLLIIKGAGHAAYLDKPEEFHELLLDFLEEISS